ncbi:MAG: BREX system P-loop protein BrxC [Acidobacteriia bacterium]|nr:BREX system P-loop protein BrxC [Terriglobia bacterium]
MPDEIRSLFWKPIDRHIEEVIKVDQANPEAVEEEISEYEVTDSIREGFLKVLESYRATPDNPHEGIGIWISGFFGSGKSSFAKILGYILEGRAVRGNSASDLFVGRAADDRTQALLRIINERIPTTAVIFDISTDRGVRSGSERITEVMYKALLRQFEYSDDFKLAQLEIDLEGEDELDEFRRRYEQKWGKPWERGRLIVNKVFNEASVILHEMDPLRYSHADSWAHTQFEVDISPNLLAERAYELVRRRRQGRALVFVIDEVGQYVSRSTDKMLDLQGVVQAFGRVGKNLAQKGQWKGQAWVVVTSQEQLGEVVDNLEGKKVELPRLKARFPIEIDLAPADISEVTSRRVLTKSPDAEKQLADLYERSKGAVATHTRLQSKIREVKLDARAFTDLYPFVPYQIDLIIDIVAGLRSQPGASRHTGGSNRTIIKLAQQVIINDRVKLGSQPVGRLVTLDMIYDLVEGNISHDKRKDISDIAKASTEIPLVAKVAKAICLLQFVRGVPRTIANIAAVLHPAVDATPLHSEVQTALDWLVEAQKVKLGEHGYELLSAEGKRWEEERQGIDSKPSDQSRLQKEILEDLFEAVKPYRHKGFRNFVPLVIVNGDRLGREGDLPFRLTFTEEGPAFSDACAEARKLGSEEWQRWEKAFTEPPSVPFVAGLPDDVFRLIRELHRSREMIQRHERGIKSQDEAQLLNDEKAREAAFLRELRTKFQSAICSGNSYFQGVQRELRSLGSTLTEVVRGSLEIAVPQVYSKFDLGSVTVKGNESEEILKVTNLGGLPTVFYDAMVNLVVSQGGRYVVNTGAPVANEVSNYIAARNAYGEKVTGKLLEGHFHAAPYGWELDVLMMVVATLFRGAVIEVFAQGGWRKSVSDAGVREPFSKIPAFRAAAFRPRQDQVKFEDLVAAARAFQEIFGEEVEIEETAIFDALKGRLRPEYDALLPLRAKLEAHGLPGIDEVDELHSTLRSILESSADEAVRTFAVEAKSIREALAKGARLASALSPGNLATLKVARRAVEVLGPTLRARTNESAVAEAADRLASALGTAGFCDRLPQIAGDVAVVERSYRDLYAEAWHRRRSAYDELMSGLTGRPEWGELPPAAREEILSPVRARSGDGAAPQDVQTYPSIEQMETDILAVERLRQDAAVKLEALLVPPEESQQIKRVKVRDFFRAAVSTEQEFEESFQALRDHCLKLIAEGSRVILE